SEASLLLKDRERHGRKCLRNLYVSGASLAAIAALGVVASPGEARAAEAAAASTNALEEVVVVARRTEERLQDVPISVTAISSEGLKQANVSSGADLIKLVPTLSVQQGATGPGVNYSLRGIRTGVITYWAEVPTFSSGIDDQLWDLSSVQALAGPQGTLFGRNATGGAILFVPQRPTNVVEGYARGQIGNLGLRQGEAVINVPVNDMLKLRGGVRIVRRDPVVKNVGPGTDLQSQKREALRLSVEFDPTSKISNYTLFDFSQRNELPYALIASGWTRNAGCLTPAPGPCLPGYTRGQLAAAGDAQEARGIRSTSVIEPAYTRNETWGVADILTWQLMDNVQLKYVGGYRFRKSEEGSEKSNIAFPIEYGVNHDFGSRDISHEVQLQGKLLDRVDWTVGYFNRLAKSKNGTTYALLQPPGTEATFANSTSNRNVNRNTSNAVYAQGTVAVTDALNFTAGVRYTEDTGSLVVSRRARQATFTGPNVCVISPTLSNVDLNACTRTLKGKWNATTYNFSVDYRINEDMLVYATTRTGYNGGGFNASVPDTNVPGLPTPTYDPEHIRDYEVGVKADWDIAGMPLRTNLSGFVAKYTNIQRNQRGFLPNGQISQGTANGPKATIRGVQLESAFKPISELTLTANYGYLFTRYDVGTAGFPKGNRFAQAPKHTVNVSAAYRHPLAQGGDLAASANYVYQSEVSFQDDQSTAAGSVFQKGYGIVDLRLGWENVGERNIDVTLFVKNATNKAYALERQDQTALFGFTGSVYNDPRTYGLELTYRFGG
ncbi:MAG: hypothetical protein JWQ29_3233, partial [Phenylobacterium sp.]|nr:hypothetical protein [Phenylobacterium sp.]